MKIESRRILLREIAKVGGLQLPLEEAKQKTGGAYTAGFRAF